MPRSASYLRLGAEIERTGTLGAKKIAAAADTCGAFARRAAELGAERATVIVTAPGRQGASAAALTAALAEATGAAGARPHAPTSEGRLAYDGAVARASGDAARRSSPSSTSAAARRRSPSARRCSAPPGSGRPTSARSASRAPTSPTIRRPPLRSAPRPAPSPRALAGMRPPAPDLALAVGGSARALAKIVGRRFDADDLERAVKILSRRPAAKAARPFGIAPERAETLLAGALLLAGASRVLGTALRARARRPARGRGARARRCARGGAGRVDPGRG